MTSRARFNEWCAYRRSRFGELADHYSDAIAAGQPRLLTTGYTGAALRRRDSLSGIPTKLGFDRDEYPFAMTRQGGCWCIGALPRPIAQPGRRLLRPQPAPRSRRLPIHGADCRLTSHDHGSAFQRRCSNTAKPSLPLSSSSRWARFKNRAVRVDTDLRPNWQEVGVPTFIPSRSACIRRSWSPIADDVVAVR